MKGPLKDWEWAFLYALLWPLIVIYVMVLSVIEANGYGTHPCALCGEPSVGGLCEVCVRYPGVVGS